MKLRYVIASVLVQVAISGYSGGFLDIPADCIGMTKFANWYVLGETVEFSVTNFPDAGASLVGRIYDVDDCACGKVPVTNGKWRWSPSAVGYYAIRFESCDATGAVRTVRFPIKVKVNPKVCRTVYRGEINVAVSPHGPPSLDEVSPVFGYNLSGMHPWMSGGSWEDDIRLIQLLGMNAFLRCHYFKWREIESKGKGQYDWSVVDALFDAARRMGYGYDRLLVNFLQVPNWLSSAPDSLPASERCYYAPKSMAPWADFIRAAVRRYPDMQYVELWNEPHLPGYSKFWNSSPRQFVELLKSGYDAAKTEKPNITVVMGGIGMRYLPFYEQVLKNGGGNAFDVLGVHGGYDMGEFRKAEKRMGVSPKPYWEDEWHTVLYNCRLPAQPTEEECAFRELVNLAVLLHGGNTRIMGFGGVCDYRMPEAFEFFRGQSGSKAQIAGIYRSVPFLEPRLGALTLRTASDRFRGPVKSMGAWAFGPDGSERLAMFSSCAAPVAFAWRESWAKGRTDWSDDFRSCVAGCRIIDWVGRETNAQDMRSGVVYFVENPRLDSARRKGVALERLDCDINHAYKLAKDPAYGVHANFHNPQFNEGQGIRFAIEVADSGLCIDARTKAGCGGLRFAIDTRGKGQIEDVLEVMAANDGTVMKLRMPDFGGDLPPDFSEANVPLVKSHCRVVRQDEEMRYVIKMDRSDLYPFVCHADAQFRFSISAVGVKGESSEEIRKWGEGLGSMLQARKFGMLVPAAGGIVLVNSTAQLTRFGVSELKGGDALKICGKGLKRGVGVQFEANVRGGTPVRYSFKIRKTGDPCQFEIKRWSGSSRKNLEEVRLVQFPVVNEWQTISGTVLLPKDTSVLRFVVATWRDPSVEFELKDFELVNL